MTTKRKYLTFLITAVIASLLGALIVGCGQQHAETIKQAPLPCVAAVAVTFGTLDRDLTGIGTLTPIQGQQAIVAPQVSGMLTALPIRLGQTVAKGQVIAQISTLPLQGQIQQAQATLGANLVEVQQAEANALQQRAQTRASILQAQANVRNAEAALSGAQAVLTGDIATLQNEQENTVRQQTLFKTGLVAEKDVEAAQLAVQTAQAQVEAQKQAVNGQRETLDGQRQMLAAAQSGSLQDLVKQKDIQVAQQQVSNAQGALATAKAQLSLYTLTAPLNGQITTIGATSGESVDTTTTIATIANLSKLQIHIGIPSADAREVHVGDEVVYTVDALPGLTFQTAIQAVASQVDPASGAVPVLAPVANLGGRLKNGSMVSVKIVTAHRVGVLIVPQSAVLTDPDSGAQTVDVIGADSAVHIRQVKTGLSSGGMVEIINGLTLGENVAVSGQYGLSDSTKVAVGMPTSEALSNGH